MGLALLVCAGWPWPTRASLAAHPETHWEVRSFAETVTRDHVYFQGNLHRHSLRFPSWAKGRTAVRIKTRTRVLSDDSDTRIFPGAHRVEWWRADAFDGPYKQVGATEAIDRTRLAKGQDDNTQRFLIHFIDHEPTFNRGQYYRVRFIDETGELLAESGTVSIALVQQPALELDTDSDGGVSLVWRQAAGCVSDATWAETPSHVLRFNEVHELMRTKEDSGRFALHFINHHYPRHRHEMEWLTYGTAWQHSWCSTEGPRIDTVYLEARTNVNPLLPKTDDAPPRPIVLYRPADNYIEPFIVHLYGLDMTPIQHTLEKNGHIYEWATRPYHGSPFRVPWRGGTYPRNITLKTDEHEVSLFLPATPVVFDFRAVPDTDRVHLTWSAPVFDPADWLEGPWVEIWRVNESNVTERHGPHVMGNGQRVARVAPDQERWTDEDVTPGSIYFYASAFTGRLRGEGWQYGDGYHTAILNIHRVAYEASQHRRTQGRVHRESSSTLRIYPIMATPEPLRPLRVGFILDANCPPEALHFLEPMVREWEETPWIEWVERDQALQLFAERELGFWTGNEAQSETTLTAHTLPADVLIHIRARPLGVQTAVDLWVDDFRNHWRERVATFTANDASPDDSGVLRALKQLYPLHAQARVEATPNTTEDGIRTIFISSLVPITAEAHQRLTPEGLQDLFHDVWAQVDPLQVVDRAHVRSLLGEWELSGRSDRITELTLGRILQADVLFAGFYRVDGDRLFVSGRLIDAASGAVLQQLAADGKLDAVDEVALKLATLIRAAPFESARRTASIELQQREAAAHMESTRGTLAGAKRAAYVDSATAAHFQFLARHQERLGYWDEALTMYTRGRAVARTEGENEWPFIVDAARMLRNLNRLEEEIRIWRNALDSQTLSVGEQDHAWIEKAMVYRLLGRTEAAWQCLQSIQHAWHQAGQLYEEWGYFEDAADYYQQHLSRAGFRMGHPELPFHPLVALLPRLSKERQYDLLNYIAVRIALWLPHQALRALVEAQALGVSRSADQTASVDSILPDLIRASTEAFIRSKENNHDARLFHVRELAPRWRYSGNPEMADLIIQLCMDAAPDSHLSLYEQMLNNPTYGINWISSPMLNHVTPPDPRDFGDWQLTPKQNGTIEATRTGETEAAWIAPLEYGPFTLTPQRNRVLGLYKASFNTELRRLQEDIIAHDDLFIVPLKTDGVIHAIDRRQGSLRWSYTNWAPLGDIVLQDQHIITSDHRRYVLVIDMQTGRVLHEIRMDERDRRFWGGPEPFYSLRLDDEGRYATIPGAAGRFDLLDGVYIRGRVDEPPPPSLYSLLYSQKPAERRMAIQRLAQNDTLSQAEARRMAELAQDAGLTIDNRIQALRNAHQHGDAMVWELTYALLDDPFIPIQAAALQLFREHGHPVTLERAKQFVFRQWGGGLDMVLIREGIRHTILAQGVSAARDTFDIWAEELKSIYELTEPNRPIYPFHLQWYNLHLQAMWAALLNAGDETILPRLLSQTGWREGNPHDEAFQALCRAGVEEALQLLEEKLLDPDRLARQARFGSVRETEPFLKLIRDHAPFPRFIPVLEYMHREGHTHSTLFAEILHRIGHPSALPLLLELSRNEFHKPDIRILEDVTGYAFGNHWDRWESMWRRAEMMRVPAE